MCLCDEFNACYEHLLLLCCVVSISMLRISLHGGSANFREYLRLKELIKCLFRKFN